MKSYVVVGLGLFGSQVATQLYEKGKNVLAIDTSLEKIDEIADHVTRAVAADAKKRDVLIQLGAQNCDCAVIGMAGDLSASVLITMNMHALGIPEIICKAQSETDKEILEKLGATKVIIPEKLAADRLCSRLSSNNVLDYIEVSNDYSIIELISPRDWCGKSLMAINVRAKYGVNIIAVRGNKGIKVSPPADYVIDPSDVLVIVGDNESLDKIQNM